VQRRFSTGQLGKGNSDKMCLQPTPEGAECLWCSDAVLLHWTHVDFFSSIFCVCVCLCVNLSVTTAVNIICVTQIILTAVVTDNCVLTIGGRLRWLRLSGSPPLIFCYVSYYLSNQFMVNRIKFFFSSLKKLHSIEVRVTKFGTAA